MLARWKQLKESQGKVKTMQSEASEVQPSGSQQGNFVLCLKFIY